MRLSAQLGERDHLFFGQKGSRDYMLHGWDHSTEVIQKLWLSNQKVVQCNNVIFEMGKECCLISFPFSASFSFFDIRNL